MDWETDYAEKLSDSKKGNKPSGGWFVGLGVLVIANLLMWFYPPMKSFSASVFSILSIVVLASTRTFKRYHRLVYAMIVPGLFAWTLVGHGFYWLVRSSGYSGPGAAFARGLAGGPHTQTLAAFVVGLLAGILVPLLILEGYVFVNQDSVQAFSGLDMPIVRKILRSLFLNLSRPYLRVEDGGVSKNRPAGLSFIGGPGIVIVTPGNAVVLEYRGKLKRVELSGIHDTKRYERIYKVIRLTSRSNLAAMPTPTYPTPGPTPVQHQEPPKEGRNVKGLRSKDGIYFDLDLEVYFQIKRGREAPQDQVLAEFVSQEIRDLPEAYFVDKSDVFKAATRFNNWELTIAAIAEDMLRDIVGQHNLDELFEPPTENELNRMRAILSSTRGADSEIEAIRDLPQIRGKICREIQDKMNASVNGDGIELTYVSIGAIDIPPEVRTRLQEEWLTRTKIRLVEAEREAILASSAAEADVKRIRARADADVIKLIEQAKVSAQQKLLTVLRKMLQDTATTEREITSYTMLSLRLIEAFQEAASEPSTKLLFPYGMPFEDIEKRIRGLLEDRQTPSDTPPREE